MNRSQNGIDLINRAAQNLKGKTSKGFAGTLIYVALILLTIAIPYAGIGISIVLFGYLTPGYINFMQKLIKTNDAQYVDLFKGKGDIVASILLGVVLAAGTLLGTLLFIIPGLIFIAFFSLSFFFLNEDKISNVYDSLKNCAKYMSGNKTAMAAYKLIYYLYYVVVTIFAGALAFLTYFFLGTGTWGIVVYVVIAIAYILLVALTTMYFYSANVIFYDEVIDYNREKQEKAQKRAEAKQAAAAEVKPAEAVKEEPKQPAKVEAKPAAPKEQQAAKPAAKKAEPKPAAKTAKPAATKAAKPAVKATTTKTATKTTKTK